MFVLSLEIMLQLSAHKIQAKRQQLYSSNTVSDRDIMILSPATEN